MYVILGPTGNTGSVVAENLLAKGQKVRAVGRDKERLSRLVKRGAEAFQADVTDSTALTQAFRGAKAVYTLIPPLMSSPDFRAYQDQVANSIAQALQAASITHVVNLSSIGADKLEKVGPVVGIHLMEKRFAQIPKLNVLHLRAGYFMENTVAQVGVIKNLGMMAGPVRSDLPLSMIATRDIGAYAAQRLLAIDFSGHQTRELQGQRDVSYSEAAKIIGKAIDQPGLNYIQPPTEQLIPAMTQMGMSRSLATLLCEMCESLNNGHMCALEPRSAANTTPTSYETFVQEVFVPVFRGQAAGA